MKKLLITLALTFCFSTAFAKDVWEYKVDGLGGLSYLNEKQLEDHMSKAGAKGWELVDVKIDGRRSWFFYKRKKK